MKKTVTIEELAKQLDALLEELNRTGVPVFIIQNAKEVAVLVSPAEWEKIERAQAEFRANVARLSQAAQK